MPNYRCKILDSVGDKKTIVVEANDVSTLKGKVKSQKNILLSYKIEKESKVNAFFAVSSKVKRTELTTFLRQFAVMIKASIPIAASLKSLKDQGYTKIFKKVLTEVYLDVQSGILLSEAFKKHPKVFPEFFNKMVAIGEVTGSLDRVMESMADYYENDRKIRSKVKSALTYPIILLVLILAVLIFITMFILPQFESTINELGGNVPTITKIIMSISKFMQDNFLYVFGGIAIFAFIFWLFFKKTKKGRYIWDYLKLHLPIIGTVTKNLVTSRFSKAFIILLGSGMNMSDCLDNLHKMLDNQVFIEKFKYSVEEVKRGRRISQSIANIKMFPSMLVEMIDVGEKSGNIEEVLRSTSSYFDECVEQSIAKATAALEPLMIVILGGIVAVVILAVLLPIISLMQSI